MMRVILVTGKGGVGKTTIAAASAVHAARSGVKTLVLSADPARSLGDALAADLGSSPVEVSAGLFAAQVDGRARERSWQSVPEHLVSALDQLGVDPLAADELGDLPGAQEVFCLLEVRDQVRDGPWDLVVVDCGPSAQALQLLAVPEVAARSIARLLPLERRIARIVSATRRPGRFGDAAAGTAPDPLVRAAEQLAAQLAGAADVLRAPSTSVRLVMTAESMALAETRRTWTALALHGFSVDAVVANRVFAVADPDCWRRTWAVAQEQVLQEARRSFAPVPVQCLEHAGAEPVGVPALAGLARSLFGGPATAEAAAGWLAPPPPRPDFTVEALDGGFVLRLPLPLATRPDLDLGRRGDDLIVAVGAGRRVLPLPSALRRCTVEGASLRAGTLSVRFVPDPGQWRWGTGR